MEAYICATCGVQYAESETPPGHCIICEDERQYIGYKGQQWVSMAGLQKERHNLIQEVEPGLAGISTLPGFAIGQRALLVQAPGGNILWDCISLLDDATVEAIRGLGGVRAIAVSHPHLVGSVLEWSRAFGDAPIFWHKDNRDWAVNPGPAYEFWEGGQLKLWDGITLIRCGGHFPGSAVLHWPAGAAGRGSLLTGDTIQVVQDRRFVTFMYSYPNLIPLNAASVEAIVSAVEPFEFERLYAGWWDKVVTGDAKEAVRRSAKRYIQAIQP